MNAVSAMSARRAAEFDHRSFWAAMADWLVTECSRFERAVVEVLDDA